MRFARLASFATFALACLTTPLVAEPQEVGKVYRIGFLRAGEPLKLWIDEFRQGLRELGYVEGHNLIIEFKIGTLDQLPQLAEELVRSNVHVIVASASSAGIAAKQATTTVPIVFTSLSHPVEIGLVKSLARPGGNITGVTVNAAAHVGKRLELLRELVPTLRQVAVLTIRDIRPTPCSGRSSRRRHADCACSSSRSRFEVRKTSTLPSRPSAVSMV